MKVRISHHRHTLTIVALAFAFVVASFCGTTIASPGMLILVVMAISLIGVPHGGLDHWTGRDLLYSRLGNWWSSAFLGGYLGVALLVVLGWLFAPWATAVAFFVISAWHFGFEDDRSTFRNPFMNHVAAVAIGGLVIWIPFIAQPEQISEVMDSITPASLLSVATIMLTTQVIGLCMLPVALIVVVRDFTDQAWVRALRNVSFSLLFAFADPIVAFAVYFCGWHSVRGLRALATVHSQTLRQMVLATMPMSLAAICLSLVGWLFWSSGQSVSDAVIRTLFIGLSAIAVPHLLLHGLVTGWLSNRDSVSGGDRTMGVVT